MIFKKHRKTISEKSFESAISIYQDCQESSGKRAGTSTGTPSENTMKNIKVLPWEPQEADERIPWAPT
jgi:hypothetical protein